MKVVFAHTDYRLYWPARLGAARDFFRERGVEVRVLEISGQGSPYAFAEQTREHTEWWRCLFPQERMEKIAPRRASAALFRALDELQPDVVFGGAVAYPSGATVLCWAQRRNRRAVIVDDARLRDVPRSWLVNAVKRRMFANADAWFLPAPSHVPDYEFWGVPAERMFFGADCVDNSFFAERAEKARTEAARWRRELDLPERFILGVGRQVEKKNWKGLVEASGGVDLVLIGNGPDREQLEKMAGRNVRFRDFVSPEMLAVYYGLATALVLPSAPGETWGLVVNEAMACGLPVLVSRQAGCAATLVEHGGNGWVLDAQESANIAAALRQLWQCPPAELARMGERSRQIVAKWGLPRFCEGAWAAFQCALQSPKKPATLVDRALLGLWNGRYRPA